MILNDNAHRILLQLGKSEQEERDRSLRDVAGWRHDTDQQFKDVQDKLRPIPDEVCS